MIHEKALVSTNTKIGDNTNIWAFTNIQDNVEIGDNCNICDGVFIEPGVRIGNNVTIKNGVAIWRDTIIEDNVFIGPHVVLTNDPYPRNHPAYRTPPKDWEKIVIRNNVSVGANATLLPGIEIGAWSLIGAGTVVTKDVKPFSLIIGNPMIKISTICYCGQKVSKVQCKLGECLHNG